MANGFGTKWLFFDFPIDLEAEFRVLIPNAIGLHEKFRNLWEAGLLIALKFI